MADIFGYDYAVRKYCKECGAKIKVDRGYSILLCEEHIKDYRKYYAARKPRMRTKHQIIEDRRKNIANVCELYIAEKMDIKDIVIKTGINHKSISEFISKYFGKNEINRIGIASKFTAD